MTRSILNIRLAPSQQEALEILRGDGNVFLTGAAGTGKSFLLRHYVEEWQASQQRVDLLASTGAAAVLIGGRTFHSFFSLRTLAGPISQIVQAAVENRNTRYRLRRANLVIVDEVSMLTGKALATAELIAREARESTLAWGGLRVIVVGDFAQLPPIGQVNGRRDWAFMHPVWEKSAFETIELTEVIRTQDAFFLQQLQQIRLGEFDENVKEFLDARLGEQVENEEFTQLFARRHAVESYNQAKLAELPGEVHRFETQFKGKEMFVQALKKSLPIPPCLELKIGALVMIRVNDPKMRYVNGTLGLVENVSSDRIEVRVDTRLFEFEALEFSWINGEGEIVASARNFPLCLAWASTIHKIQGATVSRVSLELSRLWEPGQAYVALSRVQRGEDIYLKSWETKSVLADPLVKQFYAQNCPANFGSCFQSAEDF